MTSFRKLVDFESSSSLKLNRPVDEQLARFRRIGRMWISLVLTPIRAAQVCTSASKASRVMGRERGVASLATRILWLVRSLTSSPAAAFYWPC
jgi:hypothetical protein